MRLDELAKTAQFRPIRRNTWDPGVAIIVESGLFFFVKRGTSVPDKDPPYCITMDDAVADDWQPTGRADIHGQGHKMVLAEFALELWSIALQSIRKGTTVQTSSIARETAELLCRQITEALGSAADIRIEPDLNGSTVTVYVTWWGPLRAH